jgi:hypothetical protein
MKRRGRALPVSVTSVVLPLLAWGGLTACSSDPPPRPAAINEIKPCDFFTKGERKDYKLQEGKPINSSPAMCLWEGTKFFEGGITALTLTLWNRPADAELKLLGSFSGERFGERPAVNGRRIWRIVTPSSEVKCTLLFAIDAKSSAELELSEFLGGLSGGKPTQAELCKGLDELTPRVERKLPAVHA